MEVRLEEETDSDWAGGVKLAEVPSGDRAIDVGVDAAAAVVAGGAPTTLKLTPFRDSAVSA